VRFPVSERKTGLFTYRQQRLPIIDNGKFGALPFFLAAKSSKPFDHSGRGYASSGRLSMRS
jgi:hypothetical protein